MADDELTRKIGKAIVVVTTPDVCKAPTVPTPFVSYSKFDLSIKTADTVRMTSCVSFTKESRLSMTMADQGGVGGGVKSQVFGGMCRPFKGWSSTVRAQGSEICRHDVIMEVNCAGPEGPGNTFGKVIYVESLCCASITPAGEIVAEEPQDTKPVEDSGEGAPDKGKPSESGAGTSDEGGFGKEAGKRVQNEIDGLKQSGKDLYDLATSPEARQQAIDTAKETAEAAAKDPVGFGMDAGKEILNDVAEPFETAGGQLSKGDIGGAAASAGYGILNIFNPFKKLKILEKVGKLGKKKKKGKSDSDNDNKKDDKEEKSEKEEEKSGDDGEATGEDGGVISRTKVSSKLSPQKQGRHIKDSKNWDKEGRKGYLNSETDAQSVVDAYNNGEGRVVGHTSTGKPIFEYDGVSGYNNNPAVGIQDQPTNRFVIHDSATGSHVVPTSPHAGG